MLSFCPLNDDTVDKIVSRFSSEEDRAEAEEMLLGYLDPEDPDTECAATVFADCLLLRIFDMGVYYFSFPQAVNDGADEAAAIDEVMRYAMMQEVPYRFIDVYGDELSLLLAGTRKATVEAMNGFGEDTVYSVEILTELSDLEEIPAVKEEDEEGMLLSEICADDIPAYAALCRDAENNRWFGYDYHDSIEGGREPSDRWFYEQAKSEFNYRTALYLAVRTADGNFVGEVELYGFDGRGGAEIAVRILPSEQRKGYGERAMRLGVELSDLIGVAKLTARVKPQNQKSLSLMAKVFGEPTSVEEDSVIFTRFSDAAAR